MLLAHRDDTLSLNAELILLLVGLIRHVVADFGLYFRSQAWSLFLCHLLSQFEYRFEGNSIRLHFKAVAVSILQSQF